MKTFYIECPHCDGMMEIDAESGKMLKKWAAAEKLPPNQDKMQAALQKLEEEKRKRATILDDTRHRLVNEKKKTEKLFQQQVEKVKKEGVSENPLNPFDRD